MNTLRRAWWGVSRRPNQSLIVMLILLAIGTLVIASLSIQSATEQAQQDARKALGSEVILKSYDETGRGKIEYFPLHLVETLTKQDYVEGYNYLNNFYYVASNFNAVPGETNDRMEVIITGDVPEDFKLPDIQLDAVTDTSRLMEFKNGVNNLIEGNHITEESGNQLFALIEQALANENDLHIGDKLMMSGMFGVDKIEVEIIGIFHTTQTIEDVRINMNMPTVVTVNVPSNKIYIPFYALSSSMSATNEVMMKEAIFYIDDPEHVSSFVAQAESKSLVDSSKFKFYSSEDKLKRMFLAISQVASFSGIMLWLIIISGAIILSLLFVYFVKGRLREMGVLLSLGESRFKLISQLIVESMILVIIAFSLSIFTGNIVAEQAGDVLLEQRQAAIEKENQFQMQGAHMLSGQNSEQEAIITTLDIKLSKDVWLQLVYVTCLILFISIGFPAILIFRLKPTAILAMQE